jgi:hypothetical protein
MSVDRVLWWRRRGRVNYCCGYVCAIVDAARHNDGRSDHHEHFDDRGSAFDIDIHNNDDYDDTRSPPGRYRRDRTRVASLRPRGSPGRLCLGDDGGFS